MALMGSDEILLQHKGDLHNISQVPQMLDQLGLKFWDQVNTLGTLLCSSTHLKA